MPQGKTKTPIADMLKQYNKEKNVRFHMPGHKGRAGFENFKCISGVMPYDVTEVPGTDNLYEPREAILRAEKLLARAYGARESFLLVNGSTGGIFVALASAFKNGDKIIVDENCHRSIYNAIELLNLNKIVVNNVSAYKIREMAAGGEGFKGVIITRPDYYGVCSDIEAISEACRERSLLLITDEAHGAHLNFAQRGYPKSAVRYSDFTIQSAHKTIGALNQSAFLHLNNRGQKYHNRVRKNLSIFQTSSPSYIILASADCARAHMEEYGAEMLERLLKNIKHTISEIENRTCFKVEKGQKFPLGITQTPDRLVINTSSGGFVGHAVEKYLRSKSIQVELSDENNVVCLCSVYDNEEDFERLVNALDDLVQYSRDMTENTPSDLDKKREVLFGLSNLVGRKLVFDIVQFPPGIQLVKSGEVLTEEAYDNIEKLYLSGSNILGLYNDEEGGGNGG